MKSLELQDGGGKGWANAASQHRAGREPSLFHVSALAGDHRISRLVPTFTCRTLKPPHMRGHRAYLEPKLGER